MRDPWTTLLSLADGQWPAIGAHATRDWPEETLAAFVAAGLLRETAPMTGMDCPDCPEASYRDVVWIEHPQTGESQPFRLCPRCGPEEVSIEQLRRWTIEWPVLLALVGQALGISGRCRDVVPERLWRLGKTGQGTTVFCGRALHWQDAAEFLRPLQQNENSLLVTADRLPDIELAMPVLSLAVASTWDGPTLVIEDSWIPISSPKPVMRAARRRRKRADRAALIDRLTREMERHVRSAREYARAALDYSGEARLLPRPTQRELARLCTTNEVAVSRCLRDPAARELRLLWKLAANLDQLQRV